MKRCIVLAFLIGSVGDGAFAQEATLSAEQPWQRAQTIVKATEADLAKGGIRAIGTHVADLEEALASAQGPGELKTAAGENVVLVDGQKENLAALLSAAGAKQRIVTTANPYPSIAYYLGSYYNETGKSEEALRVTDVELALPNQVPGTIVGDHTPFIYNERGAALISLKRWPDEFANFEKALMETGLPDRAHALLLRGEGFCLTELGRLDEAEKAYRDSLGIEPNNQRAIAELNYIARIRAGGAATATGLVPLQPPAP